MFSLHLHKERFKFSSSHFTIFSELEAEPLHGHNYQVEVDLSFKKLDPETGLAAEFNLLKKSVDDLLKPLDEKILLPSLSPFLQLGEVDSNIEVRFQQKFYSFPKEDCEILEVVNISSECLAQWIVDVLAEDFKSYGATKVAVKVSETQGQGVSCSLKL